METFQVIFIIFLLGLNAISAQDPLIKIFQEIRPPCFETVPINGRCNTTLVESFVPKSRNVVNIKPTTDMYLFTQTRPDVPEALQDCGGGLPPGSTYNRTANTEIFIHGWLDGVCRTAWMRESKEQLFERARKRKTSYNVILVDWTWGNTPDYYVAAENSKIVGEQVGFMINNIMRQAEVGPEKFHVIGHSFGAIAAGFTGRSVPGLRRITGLDPAYAPFSLSPPNQRITYRDARIVDIIHTNSLDCFPFGSSPLEPLGDADFYPNNGTVQPACKPYIITSFVKGDFLYAFGSLIPPICSHLQSIQYYKVSINPQGCEFVGVESDSYEDFLSGNYGSEWAVMGMDYELYHKNDGVKRKYYLTTTDTCPYYDDSYLKNKSFPFRTSCKVTQF